jgi:hypothetical protein
VFLSFHSCLGDNIVFLRAAAAATTVFFSIMNYMSTHVQVSGFYNLVSEPSVALKASIFWFGT